MIIVRISGGIGNQLFQFAFGYMQAKKHGQNLVLDKSFYDFDSSRQYRLDQVIGYHGEIHIEEISYMTNLCKNGFLRKMQIIVKAAKKRKLLKDVQVIQDAEFSEESIDYDRDVYFRGFWQKDVFYRDIREELKGMIHLSDNICSDAYCAWKEKIQSAESCSIHIRRTDYIYYNAEIDPVYYIEAIKLLRQHTCSKQLFVFSDDIEWCKAFLCNLDLGDLKVYYVSGGEGLSDIEELMLQRECLHNIMANSSFSWWAVFLGKQVGKCMIAPKIKHWNETFYPKGTLLIQAKGCKSEDTDKEDAKQQCIKTVFTDKVKEWGYL